MIPLEFRRPIGNRIYGCDDCQLVCPWNRFAPLTQQSDFHRRPSLIEPDLVNLFEWDEATFLKQMEGSAIRRIGHQQWRRNLIIAMGNAPYSPRIVETLERHQGQNPLLDEHIPWALAEQGQKTSTSRQYQRLIRIIEKGLPRDA